jgi:hypothetical protein
MNRAPTSGVIAFEPIEPRVFFAASTALLPPAPTPIVLPRVADTGGEDGGVDVAPAAPALIQPGPLSVAAGARFRYMIPATGSPTPSIHLIKAPAGMTIHHGVLLWSPTADNLGTHHITVIAKNALGKARLTLTILVTTDMTPPTPASLSVAAVASTDSITLNWTAATDNVSVAGYRVYQYTPPVYRGHSGRDGGITLVSPAKYTLLADHLGVLSYTVSNLSPGENEMFVVAAFDAAGNQSYSNIVTGSTLAAAPSM